MVRILRASLCPHFRYEEIEAQGAEGSMTIMVEAGIESRSLVHNLVPFLPHQEYQYQCQVSYCHHNTNRTIPKAYRTFKALVNFAKSQ